MSPNDFDGYFKISHNSGWWVGYADLLSRYSMFHKCIYFYNSSWHDNMFESGYHNYFRTKQDALKAFFEQCPDSEIVDESEKLHVILRKN